MQERSRGDREFEAQRACAKLSLGHPNTKQGHPPAPSACSALMKVQKAALGTCQSQPISHLYSGNPPPRGSGPAASRDQPNSSHRVLWRAGPCCRALNPSQTLQAAASPPLPQPHRHSLLISALQMGQIRDTQLV